LPTGIGTPQKRKRGLARPLCHAMPYQQSTKLPNTAQENTLGKHPYPLTPRPIYAILNTPPQLHPKSKSGQKAMKNPTLTITMNSSNQMIVRNERGNHYVIPLTITGLSTLRDLLGEEKRSIQTMIDEFYAKQEKQSMDEIKEMF